MEYKGYNIVGDGTYGMKVIKTIGRGSIPTALTGSYSSAREARVAIDGVEEVKAVKNGKNEEVSTD